jgi:hypothetical protein
MTYSTLMVQLELEHSNDARLRIAGDLAEQFGAKLIGIAACERSTPLYYADGAFAQGLLERDRVELAQRLANTEERFRAAAKGRAQAVEWRSALASPTSYVARQARAADLVITGTNRDGWALDPARRLDPSALVMEAGRPVFLVPPEVEWLKLGTVLVAWKDTREARRAVWDALPLLQRAQEVLSPKSSRATKVRMGRGIASTMSPDGLPDTASSPTPLCPRRPKTPVSSLT